MSEYEDDILDLDRPGDDDEIFDDAVEM